MILQRKQDIRLQRYTRMQQSITIKKRKFFHLILLKEYFSGQWMWKKKTYRENIVQLLEQRKIFCEKKWFIWSEIKSIKRDSEFIEFSLIKMGLCVSGFMHIYVNSSITWLSIVYFRIDMR